ncbi:hypothetical protein CDIMF43_280192 [Carnobacterium divergens]|nr:hypothetical protein CDIMF43_280192 [Carnobacterium divergens]
MNFLTLHYSQLDCFLSIQFNQLCYTIKKQVGEDANVEFNSLQQPKNTVVSKNYAVNRRTDQNRKFACGESDSI